ncbi:MAG: hypothetical protein EP303_00535 [Deltaproteobacteria bacterium]|nr:MAG: hypothetical protein EP303_00535 [Deltaproteobacteria bacterium]UCF48743.1 MAG: hypothetical protein JSU89_16525 [Myxococcales bacterium]
MGKRTTIAMLVIVLGSSGAIASADDSSYGGVTPGSEDSENLPPKAEEIPEGALMLTWPGFMMQEDGSLFFVQTSRPVKFGTQKSEGRLELVLHNTQVHLKNTFLPLETEFFDTPVTRATVQRRGRKDLVMVFEMREDATPTITQKKGKDGFNYVFVKFPP